MPRIVASIEARMTSSRLPGKVLLDIAGLPALTRLLRRLRAAQRLDAIVLATSDRPTDDPLIAWAETENLPAYRGSEEDVLARVVGAHQKMQSDLVVEVTGDSILLDPQIIDWGIAMFLANDCDVVSNVSQLSFPMGVDVQVFRLNDLVDVAATITDPAVREHVSLYFYEHPERYRILHLLAPPCWHHPTWRFQLDYPEDAAFLRAVYQRLEPVYGDRFGLTEVLALLEREPQLLDLNRHCLEKPPR